MQPVRVAVGLLLLWLLAGCSTVQQWLATPENPSSTETRFPAQLTAVPTVYTGFCTVVWANQPLPDVTAQLNDALRSAGLNAIQGSAVAYGESCVDGVTNAVVRFDAHQTDFAFRVPGNASKRQVGEWIDALLLIIEKLPPADVPGIALGQMAIESDAPVNPLALQFELDRADELIRQGVRGEALVNALVQP